MLDLTIGSFRVFHVNLQLSQNFQLPDRATRIRNLVAPMKFLVAPGKRAAVNVEPLFPAEESRRKEILN